MSSEDLIMPASEGEEADSVDGSASDDSGANVGDNSNDKKIKAKIVKKPSGALPIACPERIKIKSLPITCCVWYCEEKAGIKTKYCKKHRPLFLALQQKAARIGDAEMKIHSKLVGDFEKASSRLNKIWRGTVHH